MKDPGRCFEGHLPVSYICYGFEQNNKGQAIVKAKNR
jgi:hypothetical protein